MRHAAHSFFRRTLPLCAALFLLPSAFAAESAPPAIEKPAATLNGTGYTVLGRTFMGADGNLSFVRLFNLSGTSANVTATLVGSPSGHAYGTATLNVADHAARQFSITDIMATANVTALTDADDRFAVYLRTDASPVAVQHVLFSGVTGFFENMSVCQDSAVSDSNAALMNVHTTTIPGFTSYVTIYNYTSNDVTYDVSIYEAGTGAFKGQVSVAIGSNSTFEQPFSWFQDQIQWTPTSSEYQANIVALPHTGVRTGQVMHTVYNSKLGVYLNLTNFCTVESASSTLPVANADALSGATAGLAYSIPSTTLLDNDLNATNATIEGVTTPTTNGAANGTLIQTGSELVMVAARPGIVTFQYRIRVGAVTSNNATVTVNVSDGGPIADGDRLTSTFNAGSTSTILLSTLTGNDRNAAGTRLVNVTSPMTDNAANGILTLTTDGLAYTPARPGAVTFSYQLQNAAGTTSNTALVTLTVGGSGGPIAVNDTLSQSFVAGQPTDISIQSLMANDLNAAGAIFESTTTPMTDDATNGAILRSADSLTYTPARAGTAVFTYQVRTSAGLSNAASVTMTVLGATAAPVAETDTLSQSFTAGTQTTIPFSALVANDRAAGGASLENFTPPITDGTANGGFTRIGNDLVYTPARTGVVTFSYQIRTGNGVSNTAVVRLIVG